MITKANPNLSEGHPFKTGIDKETVYGSAHIMCWLLIYLFKLKILQGYEEIWVFIVYVAVEVSTEDSWSIWAHNLIQSVLKSSVASTPVDVDYINFLT